MRWRGLLKATLQVRLTDIAYNLKRTLTILKALSACTFLLQSGRQQIQRLESAGRRDTDKAGRPICPYAVVVSNPCTGLIGSPPACRPTVNERPVINRLSDLSHARFEVRPLEFQFSRLSDWLCGLGSEFGWGG
jgi:hypothetical protein